MGLVPVSKPETYRPDKVSDMFKGIMDRAWFTNNGPLVRKFESHVEKFIDVDHFVAMSNGTSALEAAISAVFPPRSLIAIPSFTFVAVASAVVRCGHRPYFVDVREDNWTMDYDKVPIVRVAGVVVPNTFGIMPDERFGKTKIPVVLDNAEGFGSTSEVFADLDVYSFHATKVVSCGEGGGIACRLRSDARMLSQWRDFGFDGTGDVSSIGTNAKMSEFHAALGLESLKTFKRRILVRRELLKRYRLNLPGFIGTQRGPSYNCIIKTINRDKVALALRNAGYDSRYYFYPIHRMKFYSGDRRGDLSVTENLGDQCLALPLHADLMEEQVEEICRIIKGV